ncbi:MAG TPA: hypothetical protein VKA73_00745 [Rubrobacter sp.]|nr:hypothetical protein [Rubrobacter sp.]
MPNRKKLIGGAAVLAVLLLGAGTAVAQQQGALSDREDEGAGQDDDATEQPITGPALDRARQTALSRVDGKVTGTEVNDEQGYYEVEVTRADGTQVDVHLDRGFHVLGTEGDGTWDDS